MSRPGLGEGDVYQFACPQCCTVQTVTVTSGLDAPMCTCGSPLFATATERRSEVPEYLPLDHPHTEPTCSFCVARRAPTQHRLCCAIFFMRVCNCGLAISRSC
jgi:hypothetical protein